MLAFAYGGYRRALDNQTAARDAGLPKSVTPATQAALGVHAGDSGGHGADDPATSGRSAAFPDHNNASVRGRSENWTAVPVQSTNRPAVRRLLAGTRCRATAERHANTAGCCANATATGDARSSAELQQRTSESRKQSKLPPASAISDSPSVPTAIGQSGSNDLSQAASSLTHALGTVRQGGDS